jgi:hypothetical protein
MNPLARERDEVEIDMLSAQVDLSIDMDLTLSPSGDGYAVGNLLIPRTLTCVGVCLDGSDEPFDRIFAVLAGARWLQRCDTG